MSQLCVLSTIPGRIRFQVPSLKRNENLQALLETRLTHEEGISEARSNPLTGGLLILYREDLPSELIRHHVEKILSGPSPAPNKAEKVSVAWHSLSKKEAAKRLRVRPESGLSDARAGSRLARRGSNLVPFGEMRAGLTDLLSQLNSVPVYLLLGSAGLSVATGGLADAAAIIAVVLMNAALGYSTEKKTHSLVRALLKSSQRRARVRRGGKTRELYAEQVVPGDILVLRPGDFVAADARVLDAQGLSLDESILTGESAPVEKAVNKMPRETALAERRNMVFRGTSVTTGTGTAAVVATGEGTEVGKIRALLLEEEKRQTPLQGELSDLGKQLVKLCCVACGGIFVVGVFRRLGTLKMLRTAVSLAVAAIPEGLPTIATTASTLSVLRLRKKGVFIRRLPALEALGAVEVLCLDKTGTLTKNRMMVRRLELGALALQCREGGFFRGDEEVAPRNFETLVRLATIVSLCNEAELVTGDKETTAKGSATEQALLQLGIDVGLDVSVIRGFFPLRRLELRTEKKPFVASFHTTPSGTTLTAVKGNPSEVLSRCEFRDENGKTVPLTGRERIEIQERNAAMAEAALRVLGVAYRMGEKRERLVWLGLVGMEDPPREDAKQFLESLRTAGVRPLMLTGDQPATALAVARSIGLGSGHGIRNFDASKGPSFDFTNADCDVFSRVSPTLKLRIVRGLEGEGKVVAMTGDGINDGPALRAADIGISMGKEGSELAREAGDVVLAQDNLPGLIQGIEQGRTSYENVKKSLRFILSTNSSEVIAVLGSVLFGTGDLLTPVQLLWINLVTDVFPALALAADPPEVDVLNRPPRSRSVSLLTRQEYLSLGKQGLFIAAGTLGTFAYGRQRGNGVDYARALSFLYLSSTQLLHAHHSRYREDELPSAKPRNPYLTSAVAGGLALQLGTAYFAPTRRLLGIPPLHFADIVAVASAVGFASWIQRHGNCKKKATLKEVLHGTAQRESTYRRNYRRGGRTGRAGRPRRRGRGSPAI